jgi:hypothetical protein
MLDNGLDKHAARTAYLACFHTARAYTFERASQSSNTHRGVHTKFARLSRDDARVDPELRAFLSRAYTYKATADYETGPDDTTTPAEPVRRSRPLGALSPNLLRWLPHPDRIHRLRTHRASHRTGSQIPESFLPGNLADHAGGLWCRAFVAASVCAFRRSEKVCRRARPEWRRLEDLGRPQLQVAGGVSRYRALFVVMKRISTGIKDVNRP